MLEFCFNVKTNYVEEYIKMFNLVYSERDPIVYKNYVEEADKPKYSSFYVRSNKNYEDLGRLAHKAKSSISIMGLEELANELKLFEILTKSGEEVEKYPAFIEKFKKDTLEAVEELNEVIKNIDIYI